MAQTGTTRTGVMRTHWINLRGKGLLAALLAGAMIGGCPNAGETGTDGAGGVLGNVTGGNGNNTSGNGGAGGNHNNGGAPGGTDSAGNPIDPLDNAPTAKLVVSPASGIKPDMLITLDASGSTDPDGDALVFEWQQVSGLAATLPATTDAVVTFNAPLAVETAELKFSVKVRDGRGGEATAEVTVYVEVTGEFAGHPQGTSKYRDSLTSDEAYHLLRRAAFGAKPQDVALAVQRGLAATVDDLLMIKPVPDTLAALADSYEEDIPKRWMVHLMEGPNPLLDRMTLFWHDRFATSRRVATLYSDRNLGTLHWNMLRTHALGDYRQFLEDLTLDPLMLIWLDGANSPKSKPNENYAREFWELFTLGRDTLYTEADIREGARAFTGITLLRESNKDARPIYDLLNHDETPKTIFSGRAASANYNYESAIDLTLAQPEAARYVAHNLFVFFVHDHPSDAVVRELADDFKAANYQIAPVVRKILLSQALFSPDALGNQVSSPVEHLVGVARTLDMHIHSEDSQGYVLDRLLDDLGGGGQELLNPPGVEGWHEDLAWMQDQWVLSRVKALARTMEYGPDLTEDLPYHLLPPKAEWTQREVRPKIVDNIAGVFHMKLTPEERDIYVEVLDQNGWKAFHLEDPRYQPQHVFELVRLMAMDERVIGR